MPKHKIHEPDQHRRHTYKFGKEELIAILEAAIDSPVPEGQKHLWGLDHTSKGINDESLTLVIDEPT